MATSAVGSSFGQFLLRAADDPASGALQKSLNNLRPVNDETTGLPLLLLPEGFRYRSFGWTGDRMSDGVTTPSQHDGMAVIKSDGAIVTLCRNHEITGGSAFAEGSMVYEPKGGGGCSNLQFNTKTGEWLKAWSSLAGTVKNCAGGPTPWGSWLSCEETTLGPGDVADEKPVEHTREHGWIFEVPADGASTALPLKDMGRFVHEAVAVDPETGVVYETEDRDTAGLYRFIPNEKRVLARGGRLEMLKAKNRPDLRERCTVGETIDVEWVGIEHPERPHSPAGDDSLGVYSQGKAQGASTFARLEGCWYSKGRIYAVSTSGGNAAAGQVWSFSPEEQTITLIFESPSVGVLDHPDNMTVSPRDGLVLCEDGNQAPQRLHGLRPDGTLMTLAANNIQLKGEHNGFKGDFRAEEWCGASFSPDGNWLFVNIQTPGITFAITGPWSDIQI